MGRNNLKHPIFKRYANAEIAASAFWDITPVEDNTRPIAAYAPFDSFQIQNNSDYNIKVQLNGSSDKSFIIFSGNGAIMTGHKYEWLRVTNQDAANAISANLLDVQIGVGLEGELGS